MGSNVQSHQFEISKVAFLKAEKRNEIIYLAAVVH